MNTPTIMEKQKPRFWTMRFYTGFRKFEEGPIDLNYRYDVQPPLVLRGLYLSSYNTLDKTASYVPVTMIGQGV